MLKLKNILILLFTFQSISFTYSQKLKYKELYPILKSDTINFTLAKQLLSDYIKEEPDFPNAYFQYASFCKSHLKDLDVLTETKLVLKYCDQAINNYTLFLNITSEKDLKNYKEFYPEFVKNNSSKKPDINYNEVTQIIKQYIKDLQNYSIKIKNISFLFYKGLDNYENARKLFLEINNRYLCENDIYLLADETFFKTCNQLISSYDSAVFYISAYSQSIKDFPIEKYNQQFVFKKIETYRLDGFNVETSFLINNIIVWDYGFWAKKTTTLINTEIKDLRIKLEKTEKELTDGIKILKDTTQLFSLPNEYRFNKTTLLKLKKYDFNSLVLNLFLFQKNQLDLLILMRNKQKFDTSSVAADEKFIFYGYILKSLYACDSLIKDLNITATEKNIQKHLAFINKFFGNKTGLFNYIEINKKETNNYLNVYKSKSFQLFVSNYIDTSKYLSYKGNLIPLFVSNQNNPSYIYTTTSIKQDFSGNTYLSGYFKNNIKDSINIAYILKSSKGKVIWFKSYDNPMGNAYAYCLDIKNNEVISIVSNINIADGSKYNTLVKFDFNGKEKINKKIAYNNPVICFASDSTGSNHLLVSKTFSNGNISETNENINLIYINNDGNPIWNKTYQMNGNVSDLFYNKNSFFIFGNYSYFNINNQKYFGITANTNQTSVFVVSIDNTGEKIQFLPVNTKESINIRSVKFYDIGNIHIIAQKISIGQQLKESDLIHLIINSHLQVLFAD